tara:strand:- start:174 stop:569 length:396 start_codon:yes stop_codon:yes gene_type:complete
MAQDVMRFIRELLANPEKDAEGETLPVTGILTHVVPHERKLPTSPRMYDVEVKIGETLYFEAVAVLDEKYDPPQVSDYVAFTPSPFKDVDMPVMALAKDDEEEKPETVGEAIPDETPAEGGQSTEADPPQE